MRFHRIWMIAGAIAAAACGGTSQTPSISSTVEAYRAVADEVGTAVAAYRAEAATTADRAACEAAKGRYHARMQEPVARMHELSAELDEHAAQGCQGCVPDAGCVAEAIRAEVEHHVAEGCVGEDAAAHHADAEAHAATMARFLEHQRARCEEACIDGCGTEPPAETTWTCRHEADGSFTMGGHTWRCGEETAPSDAAAEPVHPQEPCGDACGESCGDGCGGAGGEPCAEHAGEHEGEHTREHAGEAQCVGC